MVSFTNQVQIVVSCPYASVVSISTNGHYVVQGDQVIIQDNLFPYVNIIYNSTHQPQPTILVQMSIGQGSLGVIGVDSA
ncbi:hypothetical protein [Metallosphaera hakonensis]|uniref:hypothetical protein n=1 Tax=Metallosphaera hakonensis TaxID=79601 RepID=UPI002092D733|nr:hypothetical protein [Metallosphaera hakonensis]